jgi:protein required for attachment to host cells
MPKTQKCWFVVADAARAVAYKRRQDRPGYDEVARWESPTAAKPARELVTDRPGRAFDSRGGQRHAMEPPTDPKLLAKQAFAAELAEALNEAHGAKQFENLVLFAPARIAGDIRKRLANGTADALLRCVDKDLTKAPTLDLFKAFDDIFAPPP